MTCDDHDPAGKILDFSISILPLSLNHGLEVMPIRESPDTVVSDGITDSHWGRRSLNLIELEERYRIGMVSPNAISDTPLVIPRSHVLELHPPKRACTCDEKRGTKQMNSINSVSANSHEPLAALESLPLPLPLPLPFPSAFRQTLNPAVHGST